MRDAMPRDPNDTTTVTVPGAVPPRAIADEEATTFFHRGADAEPADDDGSEEATRVAGVQDLVPEELRTHDVLLEPSALEEDDATVVAARPGRADGPRAAAPPAPRRPHPPLAEVVAGRVPAARLAPEPVAPASPAYPPHFPPPQAAAPAPPAPPAHASAPPLAGPSPRPPQHAPAAPVAYAPAPVAPAYVPPPAAPVAAYAPAAAPVVRAPSSGPPPAPAALAPPAPTSSPAPPPEPTGTPRIFVVVMAVCGLFTATGVALLAYLKMRHLW